jgi:hypothetical protein
MDSNSVIGIAVEIAIVLYVIHIYIHDTETKYLCGCIESLYSILYLYIYDYIYIIKLYIQLY